MFGKARIVMFDASLIISLCIGSTRNVAILLHHIRNVILICTDK